MITVFSRGAALAPPTPPTQVHVTVERLDYCSGWVARASIGGIDVEGERAANPWAAIGSMLRVHAEYIEFYDQLCDSVEAYAASKGSDDGR